AIHKTHYGLCLHLTNFCSSIVGKLTSACWDKCITGTPGSKFSSSEASCLTNCAQRYMEMSMIIVERFQNMQ
ncbi:Mitochondrial import inner membrane translocase subunit TIM8, partial [Capsicum annuum]